MTRVTRFRLVSLQKCKKIAESKEEMAIAKPHVSDDEEDDPRDSKGSLFSLSVSLAS